MASILELANPRPVRHGGEQEINPPLRDVLRARLASGEI